MILNWIIAGLLFICLMIILNRVGPMKGSTTSDFPEDLQPKNNPLSSCTGSPNCVRITKELNREARSLFNTLPRVLKEMDAEKIDQDSQTLQTDAVFRIPVFGFRDDMLIRVESNDDTGSVLHISSRSRVGRGDLGVNRRRVKTFLNRLNNHF